MIRNSSTSKNASWRPLGHAGGILRTPSGIKYGGPLYPPRGHTVEGAGGVLGAGVTVRPGHAGVLSSGHRVPRMPFVSQDANSRFQMVSHNRIDSLNVQMTMTNAPLNIVLYVLPL